jgi:signal peptidase I
MKKTLTIVITGVALLILMFSIIIMFMGSRAIQDNEPLYIFGYSFAVVAPTGSMIGDQPDSLDNYDIAIIRQGSFDEIEIGMVIVFQTEFNSDDKILVIHRVIGLHPDGGYETKGDNNPSVDQEPVTQENFQGIYVNKITFLRPLSQLASNSKNTIFLVLILVLAILLVSEVMNIIKHIQHEKQAELTAQAQKEIEAIQTLDKERMYQEILKEELEKKKEKEQQ